MITANRTPPQANDFWNGLSDFMSKRMRSGVTPRIIDPRQGRLT
jgi:hypothetical protein